MKNEIGREIDAIERRLFKVMQDEGISPAEAISDMHAKLDVFSKTGKNLTDLEELNGGYFAPLLAIGWARAMAEYEPDNPDLIGLLSAASEGVGMIAGMNAIQQAVKNSPDREALNEIIERAKVEAVKELTSRAANVRHAVDPRQSEKSFVLDCWRNWKREPEKYRGKAEFARDMLDKCEHLKSQKVIEDFCREWEKSEPC